MNYINASYQTGLQLLMAAGAASNSGSGTSANSGTTTSVGAGTGAEGSATQSSSASSNSSEGFSSAATISALKSITYGASGPEAGVMAAIVASISTKNNDFYGAIVEAGNAARQANETLSSQQLSTTLLSGGSIAEGLNSDGSSFQTVSMADILKGMQIAISGSQSVANYLSQWVQNGMPSSDPTYGKSSVENMTPDQIGQIISQNNNNATQMQADYKDITSALANGTLKVQRASDVKGLDYVDTIDTLKEAQGGNGYGSTRTQECSNNGSYMQQNAGKGTLTSVDGVGVYLSW